MRQAQLESLWATPSKPLYLQLHLNTSRYTALYMESINIRISKTNHIRLSNLKLVDSETYDSVVDRVLTQVEATKRIEKK